MNKVVLGWSGQVLRHVPVGVPTSATFEFEDASYPVGHAKRVIASGDATVSSLSLTTTAAAGVTQRNNKRISVSATTLAEIGLPAVIVAEDGTRELFEIAAISAGSYIESAGALAGVYPSGSTVSGVRMTAAVPDEFAGAGEYFEEAEKRYKLQHAYRVTWSYTLDGVRRKVPEFVHWVRHNVAADEHVGEVLLYLAKAFPNINPPDGGELEEMVKLMAEEVADDVRARQRDPETFLVGSRGRGLLVARTLAHLGELGWAPGNQDREKWADRALKRYQVRLDNLTVGTPGKATAETDLDDDESPGTPSTREKPMFLGW